VESLADPATCLVGVVDHLAEQEERMYLAGEPAHCHVHAGFSQFRRVRLCLGHGARMVLVELTGALGVRPRVGGASIRYLGEFVKQGGQWFFAERRLMVNWIDTRPSTAG
jgi:hypothetical protein